MTNLEIRLDGRLGREIANMIGFWTYYRELESCARIADVRADHGRLARFSIDDVAKARLLSDALRVIADWREAPPYGIPNATKRAAVAARAKVDAWIAQATTDPTRAPLPPPFPVGTRVRYKGDHVMAARRAVRRGSRRVAREVAVMTDIERITRERDEAYKQLRISTGLTGWQGAIEARVARGQTVERCGKCGGDGVIVTTICGEEFCDDCAACERRGWVEVPL